MFGAQFADASAINRVEMSVPDADAESVQVFFGSLPAGLQSQGEGLSVVAGYPHRILGRVSTTGLDGYNEDPPQGLFRLSRYQQHVIVQPRLSATSPAQSVYAAALAAIAQPSCKVTTADSASVKCAKSIA